MATNISIANGALTLLGHRLITSLSENERGAKLCNAKLSECIDATLRAYNWNCATERASLPQLSSTPVFGFDYQYSLPANPWCLRVIQMEEKYMKFKVEGRKLLTDESSAKILYICRITPGEMDPLLADAISARLAADICFALTNSTSGVEGMWRIYKAKIDEAESVDAQEGSSDDVEADDWTNSRY